MITLSLTTIIAGAIVVALAILGALINPFLRSLRFPNDTVPTDSAPEEMEPVSILITAHDNLRELERNLPMFLHQKYSADYQVIVVCQSTDGETIDFLKRTSAESPHLYYTYIPESSRYMSRKKLQITLGVKAAKNEWIILTEPSCRPENDKWLYTMARNFTAENHLVLGYVGFNEKTKGVRRFENIRKAYYVLRRAQKTYGYRSHMPNVAFRKSDFMEEQGFQGNLEYVRGEYDRSGARLQRMVDTRRTIRQVMAQRPPLSAGIPKIASKIHVDAHAHVLRPSLAPCQPHRLHRHVGIRHHHPELDIDRLRRLCPDPALHPSYGDSQPSHQAL